jgi:hypothetical protein
VGLALGQSGMTAVCPTTRWSLVLSRRPSWRRFRTARAERGAVFSARTLVTAALVLGAVVLGATAQIAALTHESLSVFTRDITVGAGVPPYVGAISLLNGMVWAAAGALALFVACLEPVRRRWLVLFGGLMLTFAADDSLRLHESVGPAVGVPEPAFFAVYAGAALYLLAGTRARPFDEGTVAFVLGGFLLALSLVIDEVFHDLYFAEDAAKLLGALVWLTVPPLCLPASLRKLPPADHLGVAPWVGGAAPHSAVSARTTGGGDHAHS